MKNSINETRHPLFLFKIEYRGLNDIGFSAIQNAILGWLVDELNAISNGFVVMGVRRVIWAVGRLRRLKPIRFRLWWRSRWPSRRYGEHELHEQLSELAKKLHGGKAELGTRSCRSSSGSGLWPRDGLVKGFFTFKASYLNYKALSLKLVHCLSLTPPGSVMLWWMSPTGSWTFI